MKSLFGEDTHSYKGWLNSDSFIKRCLAVLGYGFVASIIASVAFYVLLFMYMVMASMML